MSNATVNIAAKPVITPIDEKVLVLFIHGLNGKKKTWDKFTEQLNCTYEIKSFFDIDYFVYPTSLFDIKPFKPLPNIQSISEGLKSYIDLRCSQYNKIILACHSMGGLIARRFLLSQVKILKQVPSKVKSLLLYATPNIGSDVAKVNIINPWHRQIKQLRRNSDFIEDLNEDWDIFNLKNSLDTTYILAGRDSIVSKHSAKHYWGHQSIVMNIDKTHLGVVQPTSKDDLSLLKMVEKIKSVYELPTYEESKDDLDQDEEI